jgi:hypothetical protein
VLNGQRMALVEAMGSVNGSWATYLYDETHRAARRLDIRTDKRSTAFANPTVTVLRAPSGARAIVVTLFVPVSGAARGEVGELVYFREITTRPANTDPVVAAAGDIAVLALGDGQYVRGTPDQFPIWTDLHRRLGRRRPPMDRRGVEEGR